MQYVQAHFRSLGEVSSEDSVFARVNQNNLHTYNNGDVNGTAAARDCSANKSSQHVNDISSDSFKRPRYDKSVTPAKPRVVTEYCTVSSLLAPKTEIVDSSVGTMNGESTSNPIASVSTRAFATSSKDSLRSLDSAARRIPVNNSDQDKTLNKVLADHKVYKPDKSVKPTVTMLDCPPKGRSFLRADYFPSDDSDNDLDLEIALAPPRIIKDFRNLPSLPNLIKTSTSKSDAAISIECTSKPVAKVNTLSNRTFLTSSTVKLASSRTVSMGESKNQSDIENMSNNMRTEHEQYNHGRSVESRVSPLGRIPRAAYFLREDYCPSDDSDSDIDLAIAPAPPYVFKVSCSEEKFNNSI